MPSVKLLGRTCPIVWDLLTNVAVGKGPDTLLGRARKDLEPGVNGPVHKAGPQI